MPLLFNNPAGFWLLLTLPAIVGIHFLQQRSRSLRTTTLFLLEKATPESRSGRTWERLRQSLALWCQLLAALLATWLLVEPRWVRPHSALTVVIVLDESASLGAFRDEARRAVRDKVAETRGLAETVTWILLPSDARRLPYYRGASQEQTLAALERWQPERGSHDCVPALRLARSLAGANGLVWFVTDSRDGLPPDQPAVGVGHVIPNVGFAGSSVFVEGGRLQWKAYVQNRSDTPQQRTWWLDCDGSRTPERKLELAPGALAELSGSFPDGGERCLVALSPDAFASDDVLPLQRPRPKRLSVAVQLDGPAGAFFRKLIPTIDGLALAGADKARLRIANFSATKPRPKGPAILLNDAKSGANDRQIALAPRVPARHPLMADLNWQAWLGTGPEELSQLPGDLGLLWQGQAPLLVLGPGEDAERSLLLNFRWEDSNAERLPSCVLLLRRFLETLRDAQAGPYAANFDCGAPVPLAEKDLSAGGTFTLEFVPARKELPSTKRTLSLVELGQLHAPDTPGFFSLRRDGQALASGSAQYADPRESDFSKAETFQTEAPVSRKNLIERTTAPDPFEKPALVLIVVCLLLSWMPRRKATAQGRSDR